jgi:hypothetical protein
MDHAWGCCLLHIDTILPTLILSASPEAKEEEYKVKAIVDHHDQKTGHKYKVQWVGYTTHDDLWVNADNVQAN